LGEPLKRNVRCVTSGDNILRELRDYLTDWTEPDFAMYFIGCCLGLFPPPDEQNVGFRAVKGILWSDNEVEQTLELIIKRLVRNGALTFDDEQQLYRWIKLYSIESAL
jgi:hypothetical protein